MKAAYVILPVLFLASAAPAFAGGLSLQKAVKLCKAEIGKLDPPLKSHRVDNGETSVTETHFKIAIKATMADGRLNKMVCTVDRNAGAATLAFRFPAQGSREPLLAANS